jgi:hypothetical protein
VPEGKADYTQLILLIVFGNCCAPVPKLKELKTGIGVRQEMNHE